MTRPLATRGAYDAGGRQIQPMSLADMRAQRVCAVLASCQETSCGHAGSIDLDNLPHIFAIPDVSAAVRTLLDNLGCSREKERWRV
jgi:hypothetical protein